MTEEQQQLRDEAIATAYVRARQRLGTDHHSRLVKAWELVIDGAIQDRYEGLYTVSGKDQPEYTVSGQACTCPDHTSGKAPEGFCKHVLGTLLYRKSVDVFEHLMQEQARLQAVEALQDLPEAPLSITMRGTVAGVQGTLVTLRGWSMADIERQASEVKARLGACVEGLFDMPRPADQVSQPEPQAPAQDSTPICPAHQSPMRPSKYGGWYCPQAVGDGFCQEKIRPRKRRQGVYTPPAAQNFYGSERE